MGNSQSQNNPASPHPSSALGSRRYPTPRPRTSLTSSNSPRRSSSLRSSTRPQSPPSPSHASLRAPRAPNPGASRSREKEIRDRDKEGRGIRVHHSLRTKKKSLELPDLAPAEFSLSQAVPIPVPGRYQAFSPPPLSDFVDDPSEQSRSRSQSRTRQNNETGDDSISEKADLPYQPIVIRSSIPFPINLQKIVVQQALQAQASSTPTFPSLTSSTQFSSPSRINPQPSEGETTYLVKITWRGGGEEVLLARAGDDDWNGRRKMDREEPGIVAAADGEPKKDASDGGKVIDSATMMEDTGGSETAAPVASNPTPIFSTIIALPRGTHHLRFIVDGQQRVADDLPTAVDDNGSLANYVAVGLGDVEPDTTSDGSSGSHPELSELADSTVPVEVEVEASEITPRPTDVTSFPQVEEYPRIDSHSSFWNDNNSEPPSLSSSPTMQSGAGILSPLTPVTNASTGNTTKVKSKTKSTTHERKWTQEIPLELLEAATEEENYLAYQNEVENAHASGHRHVTGFVPLPNIPPAPRLPRHLEKLILNSPVLPSTPKGPGSPSTSSATSRVNSPRTPSSALTGQQMTNTSSGGGNGGRGHGGGSGSGSYAGLGPGGLVGERTSREPQRERHSPSREGRRREREWKSISMAMNEGAAQEAEKERSKDSREDTDRPLPVTTASGTNVSQVVQERPRSAPSPSPSYDKQEIQPSFADLPTIADDTSVLPVPSHAVLHHLCTSAIKNGMLAVGGTVRYRKKFATTIYYKPTS